MRNLVLAIGLSLLSTGSMSAGEQQARIEVSGLWCPSCSFIVGEALQKSTSVEILEFAPAADGKTGVYTVSFDDVLTNINEIAAQPSEYGYTAKVLPDPASNS